MAPNLLQLEQRLAAAKQRERVALAAWQTGTPGASEETVLAHDELLVAERALAEARGEAYAVPCEGMPRWDTGAPLPHVLYGLQGIAVVYFGRDGLAAGPAQTTSVVGASSSDAAVVTVRFIHPTAVRVGAPNDEALHGHPLFGRGLDAYAAHLVVRSPWIEELKAINSVHRQFRPEAWAKRNHYLLAFHDETLECVAEGFTAKLDGGSLAHACRSALEAVMGDE